VRGPGRSILVVENDADVAAAAAERIRWCGHRVLVAGTKREALAVLASDPPDLVVLDLLLPDGSGFEILRSVRADPALRSVPVVVLTAVGPVVRRGAAAAGADAVLPKPFDAPRLSGAIEALLDASDGWRLRADHP
jgi:CheY-like chemotaxis protein